MNGIIYIYYSLLYRTHYNLADVSTMPIKRMVIVPDGLGYFFVCLCEYTLFLIQFIFTLTPPPPPPPAFPSLPLFCPLLLPTTPDILNPSPSSIPSLSLLLPSVPDPSLAPWPFPFLLTLPTLHVLPSLSHFSIRCNFSTVLHPPALCPSCPNLSPILYPRPLSPNASPLSYHWIRAWNQYFDITSYHIIISHQICYHRKRILQI